MSIDSILPVGESCKVVRNTTDSRVLELAAAVGADGSFARFRLHFSGRSPFTCEISFQEMPGLFAEIRHAVALMISRQHTLTMDQGAGSFREMCDVALRPSSTQVMVDWITGDRLFLHQFADHAPLALRLSPDEMADIRNQLLEAVARRSN